VHVRRIGKVTGASVPPHHCSRYGGFNAILTPTFSRPFFSGSRPWNLRRPNLRGGGEYGEACTPPTLGKKQTVPRSATDWLIAAATQPVEARDLGAWSTAAVSRRGSRSILIGFARRSCAAGPRHDPVSAVW
jgi:hypothetical protein